MTYFKKNNIEIRKSPEVNLITMIGETLGNKEEYACYSQQTFQAILNNLSKQDVKDFQKPFFEVKVNSGYLHCNLVQFLFFQNFSYLFDQCKFDEKLIQEAFSKTNTPEYPNFIKNIIGPKHNNRDIEMLERNIYSSQCFFNIMKDISRVFKIDITEQFKQPIHYIINPYGSSDFGFPVTSTSYKEVNLFTATCLRNKEVETHLTIFGQNFKSCHDFLLMAISETRLPTFGDKTAEKYEIIQDNILHEIVNIIKETPASKIEHFNKALLNSSFFQSLLQNTSHNLHLPSNVEFKKTFNTLNPTFYLELFNKNIDKKGFNLFNYARELHYDTSEMLDHVQELLISKNKKSEPQDVIDYLFFTTPLDIKFSNKIILQSQNDDKSPGNNTAILNPYLLSEIADWVESKGLSFDSHNKFLNTIINKRKFENLESYLHAVSHNKEKLLEVEKLINELSSRNLYSVYNHKSISNEEFTIRFQAALTEHLLNIEVPLSNNPSKKANKF